MNIELIEKYNIDSELKKDAASLIRRNEAGILRLSDKFLHKKTGCLKFKNDLTRLAVVLKASETTYRMYKAKGIDDAVFFDTMDDIRIWCEDNRNQGLKNYHWVRNHICFELFKLGRLQFQIFRFPYVIYNSDKTPLKIAENVINVHIPRGERLDYDACVSSIEQAKFFFKAYFPDYRFKYFICDSWLLYDKNKEFMDENSNIIHFQSFFKITMSSPDDSQAIERIFGRKEKDALCYPQKTSLQKAAKNYILSGGRLGKGFGYFEA